MNQKFLKAFGLMFLLFLNASTHASDYYWIGGQGSWSDIGHWSSTSGGIPSYTVIPGTNDNVFFDANSFSSATDTVFVPLVSHSRNFSYQSNYDIIFQRTDNGFELRVNGDLSLRPGLNFNFPIIIVSTNYNNQLDIGGTKLNGLGFLGNGQWTLDEYLETKSINVNSGKLFIIADSLRTYSLGSNAQNGVNKVCIEITSKILYVDKINLDNDTLLCENTEIFGLTGLGAGPACYVRLGRVHTGTAFANITFQVQGANIRRLYCEDQDFYFSSWSGQLDTLTMSPGRLVEFSTGSYKIGRIEAQGTCTKPIRFVGLLLTGSTIQGVQSASINYATFRYTNFSTPIQTSNSVNIIGNSGINFVSSPAYKTYFWIGGRGNYSDALHWATSSGGSSDGCVPNEGDTVVFDANSFAQTDTVFYDQQLCMGGMRISNDKVFFNSPTKAQKIIAIFGNFQATKHIPGLDGCFLSFYLNKNAKIECSGTKPEYLNLCASNKELEFIDNTITINQIRVLNGILNMDNRTVVCDVFSTTALQNIAISMVNTTIRAKEFGMGVGTGSLSSSGSKVYVTEYLSTSGLNVFLPFVDLRPVKYSVRAMVNQSKFGQLRIGGPCQFSTFDGETDTLIIEDSVNLSLTNLSGTFKVVKRFEALGSCMKRIGISKGAFTFVSGTQLVFDYVDFFDVSMFGKSGIVANNSAKIHFCSGFNVTKTSEKMYWIGGQGDWFDPANWSNQSGGLAQYCVPDYYDTVVFDQNSFSTDFDTVFFPLDNNAIVGFFDASGLTKKTAFNYKYDGLNRFGFYTQYGAVLNSNVQAKGGVGIVQVGSGGSDVFFDAYDDGPVSVRFTGNGNHFVHGTIDSMDGIGAQNGNTLLDIGDVYIKNIGIGIDGQHSASTNFPMARLTIPNKSTIHTMEFYVFGIGQLKADSINLYCVRRFFDKRNTKSTFKLLRFTAENETDSIFKTIPFFGYANIDARYIEIRRNYLHAANMAMKADSILFHGAKLITMQAGSSMEVKNYFYAQGNNCHRVLFRGFGTPTITSQSAVFDCDHLIIEDFKAIGSANFLGGSFTQMSGNIGNWVQGSNPNLVSRFGGKIFSTCSDSVYLDLQPFYGTADSVRMSNGGNAMQSWILDTGTIYLKAYYDAGCMIYDTFSIDRFMPPATLLPADTLLCGSDSLRITSLEYYQAPWLKKWSDNTSGDSLSIKSSGTFWFEISQPGCSFRDSIHVYLGRRFDTALITRDTFACQKDSIHVLLAQASNYEVRWSDQIFGNERYLPANGMFLYTISDSSCQSTDSIAVSPIVLKVIIQGDSLFCEGDSLLLDASPVSGTLSWVNGPTLSNMWVNKSGDYIVVRQDSGCMVSDTHSVKMILMPQIQIFGDSTFCEADSALLQVQTNTSNWQWMDGTNPSSRWVKRAGNYVAKTSNTLCNTKDSTWITEIILPKIVINDTLICTNEVLRLPLSQFGPATQVYVNGNRSKDSLILNQAGNYSISIRQSNCENQDSFSLNYFPEIQYIWIDSVDICLLEDQLFSLPLDTPYRYYWNDLPLQQEEMVVAGSGVHSLQIVDANGCSETHPVVFYSCACNLYFPNAITVNQDLMNEVFIGKGCDNVIDYHLIIYNRWGEFLFETEDPNVGWDGTFKGKLCEEGVYLYLVSYTSVEGSGTGGRFHLKGTLTILR